MAINWSANTRQMLIDRIAESMGIPPDDVFLNDRDPLDEYLEAAGIPTGRHDDDVPVVERDGYRVVTGPPDRPDWIDVPDDIMAGIGTWRNWDPGQWKGRQATIQWRDDVYNLPPGISLPKPKIDLRNLTT